MLLVLVSGCVGNDGQVVSDPAESVSATSVAAAVPNATTLRYPIAERLTHVVWANDSFQVNENCMMSGCAAGVGRKSTAITDLVPAGVPTRVHVDFDYGSAPTSQFWGAPLFLTLNSGDATIYNATYERPNVGHDVFTWLLLKGSEPLTIEIMYSQPHPTGATVSYKLLIETSADPERTPGNVPVEVAVNAGESFTVETEASDAKPGLLLFQPSGALAGRFEATSNRSTITVPDGLGVGPFIVLFDADVVGARTSTALSDQPLRPRGLEFVLGEARSLTSPTALEWTFNVERTPLIVGVYVEPVTPLWVSINQFDAQIQSPKGVVLDGRYGCQGCGSNDPTVYAWGSTMGHENLVPGTYTARVDSTQSGVAGVDIGDFAVYFA
jgi:hypothetical protein